MGKVILGPLEENDPIFKRGRVSFSPASVRESLKARIASKDKTSTSTPEKVQNGGEDE